MKKITIVAIGLIAIASFYSVCCTVFKSTSLRPDLSSKILDIKYQKAQETAPAKEKGDTIEVHTFDQFVFPGENWARIDPEKMGWNLDHLNIAQEYFEQINADACVVIQNGFLVAKWGDISKPIAGRSLRKSFLGTLFGIYHEKGMIDLSETIGAIGIDEKGGLSPDEKTATVAHLLSSRSGIYAPAAYDPNDHPPRGVDKPGEMWHYNNWDFNALGTVFEMKTGKKIFNAFQEDLAAPLGMQDFALSNTEYYYEKKSIHPAYLFETSARDDARIGLLWLNKGRWKDKQLVPAEWIEESSSLKTDFKGKNQLVVRDGYGYLFWIDKDEFGNVVGYSALGASGQIIYVNSEHNLVIVLRADPGSIFKKWFGLRLDPGESYGFVEFLVDLAP